MIRWNTALSGILKVRSGIRQGGVLSPSLFNVYADMLLRKVIGTLRKVIGTLRFINV